MDITTDSFKLEKTCVCGTYITATNYSQVAQLCHEWTVQKRQGGTESPARYICVTSVHGIIEARKNSELQSILNNADIATPDGMPVVWALRSLGQPKQQRVYGPTLMLTLCERAAKEGHTIFLYGGREETLAILREKLVVLFPTLKIVGAFSPPFRDLTSDENVEVRQMINDVKPDLLFVGISTPKQERWMASQRHALRGVTMIGVGAAFDFHAGRVKQAPPWMQKAGLEWFFRLLSEPRRLWKRYILLTPQFLPHWAFQKLGLVKYGSVPFGQPSRM